MAYFTNNFSTFLGENDPEQKKELIRQHLNYPKAIIKQAAGCVERQLQQDVTTFFQAPKNLNQKKQMQIH